MGASFCFDEVCGYGSLVSTILVPLFVSVSGGMFMGSISHVSGFMNWIRF
ncbi:hypothetical protein VDG1235_2330 [Verrucomicrobiia bacterium DG1235]|nr:hypothetical protein VDG1235_2330 [Verrucomicrobiae bacterium DG1235]